MKTCSWNFELQCEPSYDKLTTRFSWEVSFWFLNHKHWYHRCNHRYHRCNHQHCWELRETTVFEGGGDVLEHWEVFPSLTIACSSFFITPNFPFRSVPFFLFTNYKLTLLNYHYNVSENEINCSALDCNKSLFIW